MRALPRTVVRLGEESFKLAEPEIKLLLFLDDRGDPPQRVIGCYYKNLMTMGLIEIYTRPCHYGGGLSTSYRATDRGREVLAQLPSPEVSDFQESRERR